MINSVLDPTGKPVPLLSPQQIATRITQGQLLIIHSPLVYRPPTQWLNTHPGGNLALLHFVGRDATSEIEAYHTITTIHNRMSRWIVGRIDTAQPWVDMIPPVQLSLYPLLTPNPLTPAMINPPAASDPPLTTAYQNHLKQSHKSLLAKMRKEGLMTPPPRLAGYGPSLLIYITLLTLFLTTYFYARSLPTNSSIQSGTFLLAAVFLGAFWHQITFVAHDAGHSGLTGDWYTDRVIGIFVADALGGISLGWWADNHNVHHRTSSPLPLLCSVLG